MPYRVSLVSRSDRGRVRQRNEDAVAVAEEPVLLVVADGMGGHPAGDVASALAVAAVTARMSGNGASGTSTSARSRPPLGERMLEAVDHARRAIEDEARRSPDRRGMGTTLTALVLERADGAWAVGHVGDSRAYLRRGGKLRRITRDHTWVEDQVRAGAISEADAHGHPLGHVLSQSLGAGPPPRPQLLEGRAETGDVYLLCTDGLTTLLTDGEVDGVLREALPEGLEAAAGALVDAANERGGIDNVTVALARVEPDDG